MNVVRRGREHRGWRSWIAVLGALACAAWAQPAAATTNCYTEIDPYYWTFDVPSMIHVPTPQQAAQVRRSVVDYLWGGRGYPDGLPQVTPLTCLGDSPPVRGPYPATFPQQFPGLALWLDASDVSTIVRQNGRVSRWSDKSGQNNHVVQDTPTRQPIYSRVGMTGSPGILFDGLDDFLDAVDAPSLDVTHPTLFVVVQFVETTNAFGPTPVAKLPLDGAYLMKLASDLSPSARVALDQVQSTADSVQIGVEPEVWSTVLDGQQLRMFRDGWQSDVAPKAVGSAHATNGPFRLGGASAGTQSAYSGWISEVILYDHALSDGERGQIEEYLGWKYHIWKPWPFWIAPIPGVTCVDRVEVPLDYGMRSVSYLLKPAVPNGRVSIFHQGHSDFMLTAGGARTIQRFLAEGDVVDAFWMPLQGENPKSASGVAGGGTVTFTNHDEMSAVLEDARGSFIRFFLEPVVVGLNYIETALEPTDITMTGISGGGWTTHLIAALDTRVSQSYAVAGGVPLYLRSGPCANNSLGDSEQFWPPLYVDRASWLDLYALGGYGPDRKQVQVLNQFDNCCFWGVNFHTYDTYATNAVNALGFGSFRVHLDSTEPLHQIAQATLDTVITPEIAAEPIPYAPRTDLRVTQFISDDPVRRPRARSALTYEIRVDNQGASKANAALVTVTPPQGADLLSAIPSQGICHQNIPVTCELGTIPEGAAATLTVIVLPVPGLATNVVSVSYAYSDVLPDNNVSSVTIGVADVDDLDGDGVTDAVDCAPHDWTVSAFPIEVPDLRVGANLGDHNSVAWTPSGIAQGQGSKSDLLRGDIAMLPQATEIMATCVASGIAEASFSDPTIPAVHAGFWYLVRGTNACGPGPLGTGRFGLPRAIAACP